MSIRTKTITETKEVEERYCDFCKIVRKNFYSCNACGRDICPVCYKTNGCYRIAHSYCNSCANDFENIFKKIEKCQEELDNLWAEVYAKRL